MTEKQIDLLIDLRNQCIGRGVMYLTIPEQKPESISSSTSIIASTPKNPFTKEEVDLLIQMLLKTFEFKGIMKRGDEHFLWSSILGDHATNPFYIFESPGYRIELTTVEKRFIAELRATVEETSSKS